MLFTYLSANTTYVFSAYVNTAASSGFGSGGAYLCFRTASGTEITGTQSRLMDYNSSVAIDAGWERLEAVYKPTQSGTYQVAVNMTHMSGVILADDMQ